MLLLLSKNQQVGQIAYREYGDLAADFRPLNRDNWVMYKPKASTNLPATASAAQSLQKRPLLVRWFPAVMCCGAMFAVLGFFVVQTRAGHSLSGYSIDDVVYDQPAEIRHEQSVTEITTSEQNIDPDSSLAPQVFIPINFYDFGSLPGDSVVQKDFIVANSGTDHLVIQRAYTTCGCTTAHITAMTIPPGKASLVTITFRPGMHAQSGTTVRRGIIFETNDAAQPQTAIWIQAKVNK